MNGITEREFLLIKAIIELIDSTDGIRDAVSGNYIVGYEEIESAKNVLKKFGIVHVPDLGDK